MILIVGATGTNGRELALRLAGAGRKVRALVRSPEKSADLARAGVELAPGDLDDPASLDAALKGAERAFFVTAVDRRFVGWCRNFFDAAKRAGTLPTSSAVASQTGSTATLRRPAASRSASGIARCAGTCG